MIIKEVTHHGQFREERTIELPPVFGRPNLAALGAAEMKDILTGCPYPYSNAPAAELAASLRSTGVAEYSWTTWTVVGGATNVINLPTGGNHG